jgi:hypothetical protein
MKTILIGSILFLIILSSCTSKFITNRTPASTMKYPEFALEREFFFDKDNCQNNEPPFLNMADYDFDEFKEETTIKFYASSKVIEQRYIDLFNSPKRLENRLYFDQEKWLLPKNKSQIVIETNFLNSLANHIEQAFQMGVIEHLFYPDIGHLHFYLPPKLSTVLDAASLKKQELKVVYHTAERLMMKSGYTKRDSLEYRKFRYRTRNLVGGFDARGVLEVPYAHKNKAFNTLHEIPGFPEYERIGKTLYLSANKNGCIGFKMKGKTSYFDISFKY